MGIDSILLNYPLILSFFNKRQLLAFSVLAFGLVGIYCPSNDYFDCQRVVSFYPFFCMGMIMKDSKCIDKIDHKIYLLVLICCLCVFYIIESMLTDFCYQTGFMNSHGLSIIGGIERWLAFILVSLMSICTIVLTPDRKCILSTMGTRTMYANMLHMAIIFPLCWGVLNSVMFEWYGYFAYIIIVPMICLILFSRPISTMFQKYLRI